jgi:hypothetical protein
LAAEAGYFFIPDVIFKLQSADRKNTLVSEYLYNRAGPITEQDTNYLPGNVRDMTMTIKKLLVLVFLGLLTLGLSYQVAAIETFPETQSEINVTGRLYRLKLNTGIRQESDINSEYRLKLDKALVFSEGSRSERRVGELKLMVPEALQEKVLKLEGRQVMVEGTMHCTMYFSPWTAECDVLVKKIGLH